MQVDIHSIIRSQRRSLGLKINSAGDLIIHAPKNMSMQVIESFITQKKEWILKKQKLFQDQYKEKLENKKINAGKILYLGNHYAIDYVENAVVAITFAKKFFIVKKQHNIFQHKLIIWYKNQAQQIINNILYAYKIKYDLNFNQVIIGSARWILGSCSSKGNLRFSWRLVLLPINIIEYICVHEVAHIKHNNHSAKFWQEVAYMMPDYLKHKTWLKENYFFITTDLLHNLR